MQTSETALLFLQLIMRKLKRPGPDSKAGRAGMVVPNGTLFGGDVCARIKEQLLKDFNPHGRPFAEWRFRSLHPDPDQSPVLRPLRADQGDLVLRDPFSPGPQELLQNQADAV